MKHKLRTIRIKKSITNKENGVNTNFRLDIYKLSTNQSCKFLKYLLVNFELLAQYLTGHFDLDFLSDIYLDQQIIILFMVFSKRNIPLHLFLKCCGPPSCLLAQYGLHKPSSYNIPPLCLLNLPVLLYAAHSL